MAKIKFAGLGGLDEKGKNMYFFEIDSEIFVLDAGFSIPDNNNLGVEFIIPNVEYLKQNKDRIKGFFISHGHDDNFGALLYINDEFNKVPVYCSKTTQDVIETMFDR
jgi:ribonuclease J